MAHTMVDIYNNILHYNDAKIIIIIDKSNVPWFSAVDIAGILGYQNKYQAITDHVSSEDMVEFDRLRKFVNIVPHNAQPHALYINEPGLYSLIFSSQMPMAKEFKQWVTKYVLPSIRQNGQYIMEQKYKKKLSKLNEKLTQKDDQIEMLKHNLKKTKYDDGGTVSSDEPSFYCLIVTQ